ncbi:serine threonine phosphatase [Fusarium beomiforme]|uniref:Serine threonine phosphatase n=1 Tax=Fusarium beomiforme TaxID=44412 RepID=A0A9P5AG77_9HYPO|nr:serine threonine phosphatase [Fusarium beomiforme]
MMTDPEDDADKQGPTVAASANECLQSFQNCLFAAASIHPRELSMVEDQVARFSSWANAIGVFAPGSASMDHRLRYAPEVKGVVTGLLESLNYRCQTLLKSLTSLAQSLSQGLYEGSNESLQKALIDVAAEISRLNKISNTIRRASKETQALKASNFQIKDDEGNDVEDILLEHFRHHIGDRFPNLGETLQGRLARTMVVRRKRILYRRHRQGSTSIEPQKNVPENPVELPNAQLITSSEQDKTKSKSPKGTVSQPATSTPSQVKSATTLAPEKFQRAAASPSVISASKTVALGNHEALVFPPAPGFALKKRYEQLKTRRDVSEAGMKKVLEEDDLIGIGEITCPYCLYALPAQQPDVLYNHSDEWLSHLQQHRRFWRCTAHRDMDPFMSSAEYITHMREVHDSKLNDNQLRVMANRNSRKMPKLFPSCPLCGKGEDEINGRLEDHLTGHLRSLALKSLPSYEDEMSDEDKNENDSIDISRPQSRSTVRDMKQAEEDVSLDILASSEFWDLWNPALPEDWGVNFMGNAHTVLNLSSHDVKDAAQFFDVLFFKDDIHNSEHDPILHSMLAQKMIAAYYQDPDDKYWKQKSFHTFVESPLIQKENIQGLVEMVEKMKNNSQGKASQASVSSSLVDEDALAAGDIDDMEKQQKGKEIDSIWIPVDAEAGSAQRKGVQQEGNGFLVVTVKTLNCSSDFLRQIGEPERLICQAAYGTDVSRVEFPANDQPSNTTFTLEVPSDIPKSLTISIFSDRQTNQQSPREALGALDGLIGTSEVRIRDIISTEYIYSDVRKMLKWDNQDQVDYQTAEISFDISWQIADPRTSDKTKNADEESSIANPQGGPSDARKVTAVDDLPASTTQVHHTLPSSLGDPNAGGNIHTPKLTHQESSSHNDVLEAENKKPSHGQPGYDSEEKGALTPGAHIKDENSFDLAHFNTDPFLRRYGKGNQINGPLTVQGVGTKTSSSGGDLYTEQGFSSDDSINEKPSQYGRQVHFTDDDDLIRGPGPRKTFKEMEAGPGFEQLSGRTYQLRPGHLPQAESLKEQRLRPQSQVLSTKLVEDYMTALHRVYYDKCNEHPDGFRGDHELRRHIDAKHSATVKRWVCEEPKNQIPSSPQPVIPLSRCKACLAQKQYGAWYNAAAHLRRAHFRPHRFGKSSGDWPSMSVLKDWMREVHQSADVPEDHISSVEDDMDEYPAPAEYIGRILQQTPMLAHDNEGESESPESGRQVNRFSQDIKMRSPASAGTGESTSEHDPWEPAFAVHWRDENEAREAPYGIFFNGVDKKETSTGGPRRWSPMDIKDETVAPSKLTTAPKDKESAGAKEESYRAIFDLRSSTSQPPPPRRDVRSEEDEHPSPSETPGSRKEVENEEAQRQHLKARMDPLRVVTVGKKSGRKSEASPPGASMDLERLIKEYRKLSRIRPDHSPTRASASSQDVSLPPVTVPDVSVAPKLKPESDPLPRRKKSDRKQDRKEWESD